MIDKPLETEQIEGMPVEWGSRIGSSKEDIMTSFPHSTDEELLWLLSIYESEAVAASDVVGKPFLFTNFIARPCLQTDKETGERILGVRLMLIRVGDIPVVTTSWFIFHSVESLIETLERKPPYDPPVKVEIYRGRSAKGHCLKLRPLPPK